MLTLRNALWTAAVVVAVGGCGSGSGSGPVSGAGSGSLPPDFPSQLPLPSGKPLTVEGGRLSRNTWTWILRYPGNGHPDAVGRTEGGALTGAGFTAMAGGGADDTFTRGQLQVTTAVSGSDFTMTVSMTA